ncbi:hypothetical protein FGO68_gene12642 [Halteria grandinella]|uniref:Uncharacterized protein n=1 Tax=Halteria grandinella TaxID=5974 RepID=A0A8J8T6A3_HALGN|nr:hypothetical protein FGO68_gene12642 [Halteria grandinella]
MLLRNKRVIKMDDHHKILELCNPSYDTLDSGSGMFILTSNCLDSTTDTRFLQKQATFKSPVKPSHAIRQQNFIERFNSLQKQAMVSSSRQKQAILKPIVTPLNGFLKVAMPEQMFGKSNGETGYNSPQAGGGRKSIIKNSQFPLPQREEAKMVFSLGEQANASDAFFSFKAPYNLGVDPKMLTMKRKTTQSINEYHNPKRSSMDNYKKPLKLDRSKLSRFSQDLQREINQMQFPVIIEGELSIPIKWEQNDNMKNTEGLFQRKRLSEGNANRHIQQSPQQKLIKDRGIAKMTEMINNEAITSLNFINHAQKNYSRKGNYSVNSHEQNPLDLLNKTKNEIKNLSFRLEKMFKTGTGVKELEYSQVIEMYVLQDEAVYAKIKLFENASPIIFSIEPNGTIDLKIYASLTHREPKEHQHDKVFVNKTKFVINPKDPHFSHHHITSMTSSETHYLYLSFHSLLGCTFTIKLRPKLPQQPRSQRSSLDQPEIFRRESSLAEKLVKQYEESKAQKIQNPALSKVEQRKPSKQRTQVDFVQNNKATQQFWHEYQREKLKELNEVTNLKITLAQRKKEKLEELARYQHENRTLKWDSIKEAKRNRIQRYNETYKERMCCMVFIKLITIHTRLKKMSNDFHTIKQFKKEMLYKVITAYRMQAHYKAVIHHLAPTIELRLQKIIQHSNKYLHSTTIEHSSRRAGKTIKRFLRGVNKRNLLMDRCRFFYRKIVSIQRSYRSRVLSDKNRYMYIMYYWENLKVDMSKILLSDEKNQAAAKEVSIKVFKITDSLRERFINMYCDYCRLVFMLKFIQWRLQRLIYRRQEIRFDWTDEIPNIVEKIDKLENDLYGDLNPYAREIIMKNEGKTKSSMTTKLNMKKIKWHKDYSMVRRDKSDDSITHSVEVEDPGPCPAYLFMPTKVQLMKMILKAAYSEQ